MSKFKGRSDKDRKKGLARMKRRIKAIQAVGAVIENVKASVKSNKEYKKLTAKIQTTGTRDLYRLRDLLSNLIKELT